MNICQHVSTIVHAINYIQPHLNSSLSVMYAKWGSIITLGYQITATSATVATYSIATPAIAIPAASSIPAIVTLHSFTSEAPLMVRIWTKSERFA